MPRRQTETEQPAASPTRRVSMRQSCDRCHSQKLRCARPGGGERGACKRCVRQGAQCVYSFSLPKGRPSMYRSSEPREPREPRAPSTRRSCSPRPPKQPSGLAMIAMPTPTPDSPTTPPPSLAVPDTAASDAAIILPPDMLSPPNSNSNQVDPSTLGQGVKEDGGLAKLDTPWLNSIMVDTMVDWDEMQQADPNGLDSANLHGSVKYSFAPIEGLSDDFWPAMTWDNYVHQNGTNGQIQTPPSRSPPDYYTGCVEGGGDSSFSHHRDLASDSHSTPPECRVMQLSQLVTRLQSQYRTSCALMEKCGLIPEVAGVSGSGSGNGSSLSPKTKTTGALFDDRAFRSMASWLLQMPTLHDLAGAGTCSTGTLRDAPPSLGDMLSSAFVGSHQLLDIVRGLARAGSDADAMLPPAQRTAATTTPGSTSAGRYADTVTRHLILACHNLILSVYVLLLAALQHDAQLLHGGGGAAAAGDDKSAALVEIRLVSIVQLCAYLVKQQEQAVAAYVGGGGQGEAPPPFLDNHNMLMTMTPKATDGAANNPTMEVQERLAQLRTTLQVS
ncbi:hypothetical protein PG988_003540 [Apiospora saccharicola]